VLHSEDDELESSPRLRLLVVGLMVAVAIIGAVDLYLDQPESWFGPHVLIELSLIVVSAGTALFLTRGWVRAEARLAGASRSLVEREAERDAWRARAESSLTGLGQAIDAQCTAWGLTPAEREVAVMILKGLGHKQIAAATGRSERTVRQHAVAVYQKSGIGGRAELAAFFLDGLR
jgi:DNA-binding NarL/FixJ family response regulator